MTVESVIKMAATLIGIEEPVTAYLEGQDAEGKKAVDALLGCLHLVEMELASDAFPILEECDVVSTGKVFFDELPNAPLRIVSVKDAQGASVEYRVFPMYVSLPSGQYTLVYHYLPKRRDVGDVLAFAGGMTQAMLAYGVAARYCFIVGAYEEAAVWDAKYKQAIAAAKPLPKGLAMRAREWN